MTKSKKIKILKYISGTALITIPAILIPSLTLTSCAESVLSIKQKFEAIDCSSSTLTSTLKLNVKNASTASTQGTFSLDAAYAKNVSNKNVSIFSGINIDTTWEGNIASITATADPTKIASALGIDSTAVNKDASIVLEYEAKDGTMTLITVGLTLNNLKK